MPPFKTEKMPPISSNLSVISFALKKKNQTEPFCKTGDQHIIYDCAKMFGGQFIDCKIEREVNDTDLK